MSPIKRFWCVQLFATRSFIKDLHSLSQNVNRNLCQCTSFRTPYCGEISLEPKFVLDPRIIICLVWTDSSSEKGENNVQNWSNNMRERLLEFLALSHLEHFSQFNLVTKKGYKTSFVLLRLYIRRFFWEKEWSNNFVYLMNKERAVMMKRSNYQ